MALRALGLVLLLIGVIGLLALAADAAGSAECIRDLERGLLVLCGAPRSLPVTAGWLMVAAMGTLAAVSSTRQPPG
jgi:hypothetical protein